MFLFHVPRSRWRPGWRRASFEEMMAYSIRRPPRTLERGTGTPDRLAYSVLKNAMTALVPPIIQPDTQPTEKYIYSAYLGVPALKPLLCVFVSLCWI